MAHHSETMLAGVARHSRIIEIGPSFNPVAPKAAGWNTAVLDHATREGLVAKYEGHPGIDLNAIEPVDFVWTGGTLSDAVPPAQHSSFDVLLASHVIEHTPDLIAFLDAAQTLLRPDGTVVLAVPDKRFCFDFFQPVTTTGQILEAHASQRVRHHRERAFDHFAYAVADGTLEAWGQRRSEGLRFLNGIEEAAKNARICEESDGYHDLHAWHFVPSSFELVLLELGRLGRTDWNVERVLSAGGWEFFVWLRRGAGLRQASDPPETFQARRMALLKRVLLETQPQIDWLLDSEPDQVIVPPFPTDYAADAPTLGEARQQLSETRHELSQAWQRLAEAKQQHATVLERLTGAQNEASELRASLSGLDARHARALEHLAAFENSTFWRASAPFRRVLDRLRRSRTIGVVR